MGIELYNFFYLLSYGLLWSHDFGRRLAQLPYGFFIPFQLNVCFSILSLNIGLTKN
jgi:hypothetical protein